MPSLPAASSNRLIIVANGDSSESAGAGGRTSWMAGVSLLMARSVGSWLREDAALAVDGGDAVERQDVGRLAQRDAVLLGGGVHLAAGLHHGLLEARVDDLLGPEV